jgi:hypothetical protein
MSLYFGNELRDSATKTLAAELFPPRDEPSASLVVFAKQIAAIAL